MFPALPETYVDHLVRPRHVGEVSEPHAAGEVGSMVGGLGVRMSIAFETQGVDAVVRDVRGRSFGTPAPVPALSWLADAVAGLEVGAAQEIGFEALEAALTEGRPFTLPTRVVLGARMAVQALHRALGVASAGAPADVTGAGILVCRCLGVSDREISAAIEAGAHTPEAIGDATRACTGCRSCRIDLLALIDALRVPEPPAVAEDRHPVEQITLSVAGRVLRRLGVPLLDARVAGDTVHISLGTFAERPGTTDLGAVAITRGILRETVWNGARVVQAGQPSV